MSKEELLDIRLLGGQIKIKAKPITTVSHNLAESRAQKNAQNLAELVKLGQQLSDADPALLGLDLENPEARRAAFLLFLIQELAIEHIVEWSGVAICDKDGVKQDAPLTRETVCAVMRKHPLGQEFYHQLTAAQLEGMFTKKDGGTGANGILVTVPNIVSVAKKTEAPAQQESVA